MPEETTEQPEPLVEQPVEEVPKLDEAPVEEATAQAAVSEQPEPVAEQPESVQPDVEPVASPAHEGGKYCIWAILSLIFAFLFWPLGLVFGIIALVQIKKNPALKGKGLAIAGLVISVLAFIFLIVVMGSMFAFLGGA